MKNQQIHRLKSQIRALRRQLQEERAANDVRAAFDRNIIADLRRQLRAAMITKETEVDVLIDRLQAAAHAAIEQCHREYSTICKLQHTEQ